jgi:hypothetical protein
MSKAAVLDVEKNAANYVEMMRRELDRMGLTELALGDVPDDVFEVTREAYRRRMRDRLDWKEEEIDFALNEIEARAKEMVRDPAGVDRQALPLAN